MKVESNYVFPASEMGAPLAVGVEDMCEAAFDVLAPDPRQLGLCR